jgi:hypothetical protein
MAATPRLRPLADDLWVAERRQRFWGLEVGSRMTVVRLDDGSLWLHSSLPLDAGLRRQLDELGPVRHAVAPNRFHHLHAGEVARHYPATKLWIGPGVEKKRPDLIHEAVLGDVAPAPWRGQLDQLFFRGRPLENEVVFLHRASKTLVMCDLAFNFGPEAPPLTRMLMRVLGGFGRLEPSRLDPLLIEDRAAARACMERIVGWDFDRVIVAHGEVLEGGGPEALRRGYHWLLEG